MCITRPPFKSIFNIFNSIYNANPYQQIYPKGMIFSFYPLLFPIPYTVYEARSLIRLAVSKMIHVILFTILSNDRDAETGAASIK